MDPELGKTHVTIGLLGVGKSMSSLSSVGSDVFLWGAACPEGEDTVVLGHVKYCWEYALSAP